VPYPEFALFYEEEMPKLLRYLLGCFGGTDFRDAADAAQNAFAELLVKWATVRNHRAWLRTVAFREMLRQRRVYAEEIFDPLREEFVITSASERLELREQEEEVIAVIYQLPLTQRQVFALHYDQFQYREIAEILGMTEAAVRKNLSRARKSLQDQLISRQPESGGREAA
jgi:RNA polymerase sigma-70 factor (ECF subfamily)